MYKKRQHGDEHSLHPIQREGPILSLGGVGVITQERREQGQIRINNNRIDFVCLGCEQQIINPWVKWCGCIVCHHCVRSECRDASQCSRTNSTNPRKRQTRVPRAMDMVPAAALTSLRYTDQVDLLNVTECRFLYWRDIVSPLQTTPTTSAVVIPEHRPQVQAALRHLQLEGEWEDPEEAFDEYRSSLVGDYADELELFPHCNELGCKAEAKCLKRHNRDDDDNSGAAASFP